VCEDVRVSVLTGGLRVSGYNCVRGVSNPKSRVAGRNHSCMRLRQELAHRYMFDVCLSVCLCPLMYVLTREVQSENARQSAVSNRTGGLTSHLGCARFSALIKRVSQLPCLTCGSGRMCLRSSSANQRGSLSSWKAYLGRQHGTHTQQGSTLLQ
jgi:hypothetical protein